MAGATAIRRLGFSVLTAEDGDEALDLVVNKKSSFRLILLDKNMARVGGVETVEALASYFEQQKNEGGEKEKEKDQLVPRIIGCTGDALNEDNRQFLEAGAERVCIKPLTASVLSGILKSIET
uniref:Response regulatory domain-containing protein n=1 Tax=Chromera velia CCMP2878 TaxID=1169474 RepID=A0A0G4FW77_9ALVE|eukprot:Cvel_465.t1-p1 / transcript=Cvel_465.t1 / gene=Cvel_465 / organism=Chromera_velia_CCMP2878 / gene_product=hypothetical protein / transcript_product=hypothetical protein / location=Cvel_scaffold15:8639-9004(-) / protein_length=122 / sequence_SO=supercontig / SO=protein_coding / is_pseudo=false